MMLQLAAVLFTAGTSLILWWVVDYVKAAKTRR